MKFTNLQIISFTIFSIVVVIPQALANNNLQNEIKCENGQFFDNASLKCITCTNQKENCTECDVGSYIDTGLQACIVCDRNGQECDKCQRNEVLKADTYSCECRIYSFRDTKSQKCIICANSGCNSCKLGQYADTNLQKCIICNVDFFECDRCENGKEPHEGHGQCLTPGLNL